MLPMSKGRERLSHVSDLGALSRAFAPAVVQEFRVGRVVPVRTQAIKVDRLAIDGGAPVRIAPPPHWPTYAPDEVAAVVETLRSGNVNQWTGQRVCAFERAFAKLHERSYAVAVANGSVALE